MLVERSEHVNPNLNKNLGFGLTEKKRFSLDVGWGWNWAVSDKAAKRSVLELRGVCSNPRVSEKFGLGLGLSLGLC